ncbi:MAG: peptide chain release factor N(5)-glutamine methyltransferase [Candidatus Moranbacteria bacterium]|nr:peptide chain release factor N(5)-glutamine methyltransferase [Candidatus Moranbacteria bacterium]
MTLRELAREFRDSVAPEDFDLLAAFALGQSKEFVMREPGLVLDDTVLVPLRSLLDRRARHEPVAYIVGDKEFYGLPFFVTRDTLVPRPETEILVEEVITRVKTLTEHDSEKDIVIADIGTGSGAIIISLAEKLKDTFSISYLASDISSAALNVARRNAVRHNVDARISLLEGDLLAPITDTSRFSDSDTIILVANLPYLSETIFASAPEDVRSYEPLSALVTDDDGLALYLELLNDLAQRKSRGEIGAPVVGYFEISPEQSERIKREFASRFPDGTSDIVADLSGRPRVLSFLIK